MNKRICSCCMSLAGAIDRYLAKAEEDLAGSLADMGFVDAKGSVEEADALVAGELRGQTKRIADFLKGCASLEAAKLLLDVFFDEDVSRGALQEIFGEYYRENIPKLANFYIRETDGELAVNQIRQRTAAWMEEWSEELSDLMQLSSEQQMGKLVQEALEKGDSVDDLARRIVDAGIRNEQWQARRAALTEMLRAHSAAQQEAMTQDPSVCRKKWRHTGSYRIEPRKNHVDMDGQVVPVDEPYELKGIKGGTYHPMYPRDTGLPPEESINCHCLSQPVVDDDVLGMSLEERQKLQRQIIEDDDGKWMEELDAQNKAKAGIESDERESSKPKYDSQRAVINRKQIASAEYRRKYDALPENKDIQRKVCANARKMLRHRSGTKYEDLVFIDSETGKSKTRTDYNKAFGVSPSKSMRKMIENADDYTIIGIHNHPHSSVPSINDLYCAKNRKYKYGIVACHDGTVYKYSVRGEINEPIVNGGLDFLERAKYIEDAKERELLMGRAMKAFKESGIEMEVLE